MGYRNFNISLLLAGATVCLGLTGCEHYTQTTSGAEYLRSYKQEAGPQAPKLDADVRAAASVEPLLRFPARIGIARITKYKDWRSPQLSGIPEEEAAAWQAAASKLGPSFGAFVPVSPLVMEMVDDRIPTAYSDARWIIRKIQLGAARQHLDAVIVYESDGTADSRDNPLSIGEWTLIGAFILPSQDVKARGVAQAIMIDARNGYPYGTAQAEDSDETSAARFSRSDSERDLGEAVRLGAVKKLAPQVEQMIREVRTELVEKRAQR